MAKKAAKKKAAKKAAGKKSTAGKKAGQSLKSAAVSKGKELLFGKSGGGGGARRPRTAKQLLKQAYERKARQQIRVGQLGLARRTLRKRATVV